MVLATSTWIIKYHQVSSIKYPQVIKSSSHVYWTVSISVLCFLAQLRTRGAELSLKGFGSPASYTPHSSSAQIAGSACLKQIQKERIQQDKSLFKSSERLQKPSFRPYLNVPQFSLCNSYVAKPIAQAIIVGRTARDTNQWWFTAWGLPPTQVWVFATDRCHQCPKGPHTNRPGIQPHEPHSWSWYDGNSHKWILTNGRGVCSSVQLLIKSSQVSQLLSKSFGQ